MISLGQGTAPSVALPSCDIISLKPAQSCLRQSESHRCNQIHPSGSGYADLVVENGRAFPRVFSLDDEFHHESPRLPPSSVGRTSLDSTSLALIGRWANIGLAASGANSNETLRPVPPFVAHVVFTCRKILLRAADWMTLVFTAGPFVGARLIGQGTPDSRAEGLPYRPIQGEGARDSGRAVQAAADLPFCPYNTCPMVAGNYGVPIACLCL